MRKLIKIEEGGLTFSDGTTIQDYHDADCCEHVYADWEAAFKDTTIPENWDNLSIEAVPGSGFRVNGVFVACYDVQNGYYGNNLALIIQRPDKDREIIDITGCTKEDYY